MEWREEGLLLSHRRHGESSAIIEVMTRSRGRHAGLVRGGASRRLAPILQPGAQLDLTWRARLEEHLGHLTVEPIRARTALLSDRGALAGLSAVTALTSFTLAERQAYPALYDEATLLLDLMDQGADWQAAYIGWEVSLLTTMGFGLDLSTCAVTGDSTGLAYVSPRTGRAISAREGAEWADRLLPLPPFLRADAGETPITAQDLRDGLRLTGHFLTHWLCPALNRADGLPPARERLVRVFSKL